jgi:hypothetical protein
LCCAAKKESDEQKNMRDRCKAEDDPEVQKKVTVKRGTVCAGVDGQQWRQSEEMECRKHSLKDNSPLHGMSETGLKY